MPRSVNKPASRKRKKRILKRAKGFRGGRRTLIRTAKETVIRSMAFSTRDRKNKKRTFRRLWITRLSAACKSCGVSYSRFIRALQKNEIAINRKVLSDIAIQDFDTFKAIVEKVKKDAA